MLICTHIIPYRYHAMTDSLPYGRTTGKWGASKYREFGNTCPYVAFLQQNWQEFDRLACYLGEKMYSTHGRWFLLATPAYGLLVRKSAFHFLCPDFFDFLLLFTKSLGHMWQYVWHSSLYHYGGGSCNVTASTDSHPKNFSVALSYFSRGLTNKSVLIYSYSPTIIAPG